MDRLVLDQPITQIRYAKLVVSTCLAMAYCLGVTEHASSQTNNSYPMLLSVRPTATQIGGSTEHEVNARYNLAGATQVMVSGTGVHGEVIASESEKPEDAAKNDVTASKKKLRFTVDSSALPGIRDFKILTPHGISTVGQLVVAREPVLSEAAENDSMAKAQSVTLPATICGAIEKAEDIDFFRFAAEAGTSWTFHMVAQRLQNRLHDMQVRIDPLITLRSETGATLASSDNVLAGDPLLHYQFERTGEYFLEVRDVRYQGNVDWTYAIEVGSRPFAMTAYPVAVSAGTANQVQLVGFGNLGAPVAIEVPDVTRPELTRVAPQIRDIPINSVVLFATHEAIVVEKPALENPVAESFASQTLDNSVPNSIATDSQTELTSPFDVPSVLSGILSLPGEVDRFSFTAKAQERFTVETIARRAGSDLDAKLRILNEAHNPLAEFDDMTFDRVLSSDAMLENWTAPADGKYIVEIRDLHGRGGKSFPYALRVTRSAPYFLIEADTDKTLLSPGSSGIIYVKGHRRNGFDGEIQLSVEDLPAGVSATCGRILAGGNDGSIVLRAAGDSVPVVGNIRIIGTAKRTLLDGNLDQWRALATPMQEVYLPGGGRGHYPVDSHTVSIGNPMDVRRIELSTKELVLQPGSSQRVDVTIERADDYKGNVTLDVMMQHLEQPYGNPLPKGVTVDVTASKTLLTANETAGYITLKATPDAPKVESQLVPVAVHVSINFVMKHTFASDPLYVSVR